MQARYFEDYQPGLVWFAGGESVYEKDVVEFAERFDPQWKHTDPLRAAKGPFAGLIASGWHTASLISRVFVSSFINQYASLGPLEVHELRWLLPVRPGDTLSAKFTVLSAERSHARDDRGSVCTKTEVLRHDGEVVMTMTTALTLRTRPS